MFTMKTKKSSTVNLSVSLPPHLREVARQAAFDDNRSVSSLVACALQNHLRREGYLDAAGTPSPARH
jgi:post-segregation antitoxin (ccd killing protein)